MTPFTFMGIPVSEEKLAKLPDQLVCLDTRDGALVVRRHTERYVPVPRKPVEK
jgi:hypothetical protein